MTEKWTPGEWEYFQYYSGAKNEYGVGTSEFDTIAHVRHGSDDIAGSCEANAQLIAAAPDLYEALASFLENEKFQVGVGGNPIAVEKMLAHARAALKKARGET